MAKSINEFRLKLLGKIRQANSGYAINRYITTAMRTLVNKKVNGYLIIRFIERSITDLESDYTNDTINKGKEKINIAVQQLRRAELQLTAASTS